MSRLLIVSLIEHQHQSWALSPDDESLTRLVDEWFAANDQRVSVVRHNGQGLCPREAERLSVSHPCLREAGFAAGATIDTGQSTSYCVFWGLDTPRLRRGGQPAASPEEALLIQAGPLWRQLEIALNNMARMEYLRELSHIDSITGVFNRRYFNMRLTEEVARAKRFQRPLSLALFDIDHFKALNDTYGHQAGDTILRGTAEFVRWTVRSIDVFCRLGGDEFAVLMPDAGLGDCTHFGERLRSAMAGQQFTIDAKRPETAVGISIGGAVFPKHADDHERLLWCADMALLHAKQRGRNRFVLYSSGLSSPGSLRSSN